MILHIPHSSRLIPENLRDQIILSDEELSIELLLMTDAFTDELFFLPDTSRVLFPISRLLVDVERFPDDTDEPMSRVGMGIIYSHTAYGKILKRIIEPHERMSLISQYYAVHHQSLITEVKKELRNYGKAIVVDCHSFPMQPLPCDLDRMQPRPEFCIGTDDFHTPKKLSRLVEMNLKNMGYSVELNRPFRGTIVPIEFFRKEPQVESIMIEVNRSLYIDEMTGVKKGQFEFIKNQIQTLLYSIVKDYNGLDY